MLFRSLVLLSRALQILYIESLVRDNAKALNALAGLKYKYRSL